MRRAFLMTSFAVNVIMLHKYEKEPFGGLG